MSMSNDVTLNSPSVPASGGFPVPEGREVVRTAGTAWNPVPLALLAIAAALVAVSALTEGMIPAFASGMWPTP